MILLKLKHYKEQGISVGIKDQEERLFSTHKKAEDWLIKNGFSYRPRTFLKGDPLKWCHEGEESWNFIDVQVEEIEVDDERTFLFEPEEAPWLAEARREGFIEGMQERGCSLEVIKAAYEAHFGEKCMDYMLS